MKVLIVDDDKNSRELLHDLLEIKNVECVVAKNGNEALKLVSPEIKLCITDISMPGLDGCEVAKQIKEKYPKMPIIVYTASISKAEKIKMICADLFSAELQKPINLENFNQVIDRFINPINE